MKNTILILISILMVVCGTLMIISSSGDYTAEKLFYQALKINNKIVANPDVAPPRMLTQVEEKLQKILQRYPESKMARLAHLGLAEFYLNNKKYERARSTLDEVINTYTEDKAILSKAHFFKGIAYEKENRWDMALREYTIVRNKYTDTPIALQIPLYIGNYYKGKQRYAQANNAYHEAVIFYKKVERENRRNAWGYAAANLLMRAYMELKQYEQAGKAVEEAIEHYPKLLPLMQQLSNIELIFIKTLNKPERAIEIYNKIKAKTDDPNLIKLLEAKIKALEAEK